MTDNIDEVMVHFGDRLGKDGTKVVKRRGKRRIIFTEEATERLKEFSTAENPGMNGLDHGVVMGT